MVQRNVDNNRLHFSTSLAESLEGVEVVFGAVGTPPDEDGSADLKYVLEVAKEVGSIKEEMAAFRAKMEKMSKTPAATKISTFNNEAPATPVDAVDARIESLNSLRAEIAKTRKY